MNDLSIIGISVVIVVLGVIFIPKLLQKFNIEQGDIQKSKSYLDIAELLLDALDLDEAIANRGNFILDVADKVVDIVQELADPNVDKSDISHRVLDQVLSQLGIRLTIKQKQLVEIVIQESLQWYENRK